MNAQYSGVLKYALKREQYRGSIFKSAGDMKAARAARTATVLANGSVLMTVCKAATEPR
jgi:hypothetical protein